MDEKKYAVGLIGTGYIAHYHARALRRMPGVRLAAVCDVDSGRAATFAATYGIGAVYQSHEIMLGNEALDVVHVLTPPEHHFSVGRKVLESGSHLFVEKPLCTDSMDCDRLLEVAEQHGLRVGANHNFLFHSAYERLRDDVRGGILGAVDHVAITWALEFPQLRAGPFDLWALQDPTHILLEIGPHALAAVLDLGLAPESLAVRPSNEIVLPGNLGFYRRWQISMSCNNSAVDIYLSFAPGFARRIIEVSGNLGTAVADLERNNYVRQANGRRLQDFGKYDVVHRTAQALGQQARRNLAHYVLSKLGLSRQGNAYVTSMEASIRAFYEGLGGKMDPRCSGQLGRQVIEHCTRLAASADVHRFAAQRPTVLADAPGPADVLVLGGTGFIGRELVRQLLKLGRTVRVMTRGRTVPFDANQPQLQVISGDVRNEADLARAIAGAGEVFHLARAGGGSWKEYYEQDVLGTQRVALACMAAGVHRMVYASSIVGYNLGGRGHIREDTPFDPAILRQNKYARAKAQAEELLLALHRTHELPVVIVRPGMVIGRGGDSCHGGLGTWNGLGCCVFWGNGRGKLPLVLVEDVARGLIAAMDTPEIEGQSFNLVDEPLLSAREYVEEIERFAGIRVQTYSAAIWKLYANDLVKWMAKIALRMPERYVPRYRMWKGRMARAVFDCSKARDILGWQPAADRDALVTRGIHVHLVEFSNWHGQVNSGEPAGFENSATA